MKHHRYTIIVVRPAEGSHTPLQSIVLSLLYVYIIWYQIYIRNMFFSSSLESLALFAFYCVFLHIVRQEKQIASIGEREGKKSPSIQ